MLCCSDDKLVYIIHSLQLHKFLLTKILKVNPGTSCIFMSSGHLNSDFVVELFCDVDHWVVNVSSSKDTRAGVRV